ncbi:Arrestin-N domain-containing protein [Mycena kentingensis (nom. inval.)]|nr:Arrestin-N domain-containing protein [Mycena kentingensis (nom. inval.)]
MLMSPKDGSSSPAPVFVLCFPDAVRVAGQTIQGRVELDLARAQDDGVEDVRVILEGSIVTTIIESNSDGSDTKHQRTVHLIDSTQSLWQRGAAFPAPGSHILPLPFEFTLPDNLPPSFTFSLPQQQAQISYTIEIVGSRRGLLRKDRRVRKTFAVLPAASPAQLEAKTSLKQGWNGPWKATVLEQKLRPGIWGDYAHARVEVKTPNMASFPRATAVPLKIAIETRTKPMSRTDTPFDKARKPLFPAPPTEPSDVKLHLHREAHIRTQRRSETGNDCIRTLGSLGDTSAKRVASPPEWIPDLEKPDRGVWKRTVQFETSLSLPYAPTFSTETLECKYFLRFTVPFPSRNDLQLHVPIHLDPAHACPPPDNINYAFIPPEDPPPLHEFPPSYLTAIDQTN